MLASTGNISMVNTQTGEIRELYHTEHQTLYGTRRTGVAIDIAKPFHRIWMDARHITPPFTPGTLRGGTHAHNWSADGKWSSFTYNDYIIQQLGKKDPSVKDIRIVGVMIPGHVHVANDPSKENNSGEMFSVIVAKVIENPQPGSDEIDKALDEGWIGTKGYKKSDGKWKHRLLLSGRSN